jgi:hypothetical protein
MKKTLIAYTLLFSTTLLLQNCASSKERAWLQAHQTSLATLANSNTSAEEKLDGLMTTYGVLMEQGLQFVNPAKGVKYIQKFQKQNQTAIDKILADGNIWMSNLDDMQTVSLGLRLAGKPYIRQYIDLVPKFKRKYETYKFVLDLTGKVIGGFGRLGSKVLKNI